MAAAISDERIHGSVEQYPALVVGHYCHDLITLPGGTRVEALGGSVSFITNIFEALGMKSQVVAKVGPDFKYSSQITHPPLVVDGQNTTEFFADFSVGPERVLTVGNICDPIFSSDIPSHLDYGIGLAVGIAGEILPETLERMIETSRVVVVDVQGLIRSFDPVTRAVTLRRLEETPFYRLLNRISFLKMNTDEAPFLDLEAVRKLTCVILTEGENGCRVYSKDSEIKVPPFTASVVDTTGAGDSFLAGFSAALFQGLSVSEAALVGNYFGCLAVEQVGGTRFSSEQLEKLKEICKSGTGESSKSNRNLSICERPAPLQCHCNCTSKNSGSTGQNLHSGSKYLGVNFSYRDSSLEEVFGFKAAATSL